MSDNHNLMHKKTGRPTKLTPQLKENICNYISAGNYLVTACAAVGIAQSTYFHWLELAEQEANDGGGVYLEFMEAVKRAEAEREAKLVDRLIDGAMPGQRKKVTKIDGVGNQTFEIHETGGDWLAAATFLERRHPDRWGKKERTAITIDEHKQVTITHVEVMLPPGVNGQAIEGESREVRELEEGKQA